MIIETKDLNVINTFLEKFNTKISNIGIYSIYYIYVINDMNVGFICYDYIYDRIELEYIYVCDDFRNKGIASKLLLKLISESKKLACNNITLEVNENNIAAINLYKKFKFSIVAKREKYYGSDNGLLMMREMN